MNAFEYVQARTLQEAVELAKDEQTLLKAGGVDLVDQMKEATLAPKRLVHLGGIAGLATIREEAGGLRMGPAVTLAELGRHEGVRRGFLALAQAAGSAATPQIRNVATVAGNLCQRPRCWYFRSADFPCLKKGGSVCYAKSGENRYHAIFAGGPSHIVHPSTLATALLACDAQLVILQAGGKQKRLALADFFVLPKSDPTRENVLEPGQAIAEIFVPAQPGTTSAYRVAKERQVYDWPLGEVAVVLARRGEVVERARIVLGAAAPIPWRVPAAEQALIGKSISQKSAQAAAKAALAAARPLGDNAYKVPLFEALIERTLLAAAGKSA